MGAQDFARAFAAGDGDAFVADLAPGFGFFHATHAEPSRDHDFLRVMISLAREAMGPEFRWVRSLTDGEYTALHWAARIAGVEAEGVDLVREREDGRLLEVRINMRPADAAVAWREEMSARMKDLRPH